MSQTPRILIVEDDKFWIDNCRRALGNYPLEIQDAMKVSHALDALQKTCFATVLVDLEIPGLRDDIFGGFEVLQAARNLNPYTELVVITAHREEAVLNQVSEHQVMLCITKPVQFRELQFAAETTLAAWGRRLDSLVDVLECFPTCERLLADRKHNRPPFKVVNEYDVQDLLHSILRPSYPDIVAEEHAPKRAGSSKRLDFVIPGLETVIETKMIRSKTHAKKIADELDIDVRNYPAHSSCKRLLCFVYDPDRLIVDPRKLEKDLSGDVTQKGKTVDVCVLIRPA